MPLDGDGPAIFLGFFSGAWPAGGAVIGDSFGPPLRGPFTLAFFGGSLPMGYTGFLAPDFGGNGGE